MKTLMCVFIVACYSLIIHAADIEQALADHREAAKCVRAKTEVGVRRDTIFIVGNTCIIKGE